MSGKLKTKGNMMLATKLDGVLKVNYVFRSSMIRRWRTHPPIIRLPRQRLSSKLKLVILGLPPSPLNLVCCLLVIYPRTR